MDEGPRSGRLAHRIAALAVLPLGTGLLLGLVAYGLVAESGSDSPSPTPTAVVIADPPLSETPSPEIEAARAAIEADNAKPDFRGVLGQFNVVGINNALNYPPCGQQADLVTADALLESELYWNRPGLSAVEVDSPVDGPAASGCDGVVIAVGGQLGSVYVSRYYFLGETPQINIDAPIDRLELVEVAGRGALMEHPVHDLFPGCRLFTIERPESSGVPGILWAIDGQTTCEEAVALSADLLAEFAVGSAPPQAEPSPSPGTAE